MENILKGYKDSKFALAQSLTNYSKDLWEKDDIENANETVANRIIKFVFNLQEEAI